MSGKTGRVKGEQKLSNSTSATAASSCKQGPSLLDFGQQLSKASEQFLWCDTVDIFYQGLEDYHSQAKFGPVLFCMGQTKMFFYIFKRLIKKDIHDLRPYVAYKT